MMEVRLVVVGPTNAVQVVDMHTSVATAARVACERCFAVIVDNINGYCAAEGNQT